ncbi:carbohydrate-binding protein [Paenibacillus sp. MAH-36]|uniref:Ig-like protein group 2 n=1 Tax=Paenibacillus violae TaxID=3077234 RepID=A0ABU3RKE0_9BACL|nr:hypothetical protein [Paenibacillus sp. PFR10]MDU0204674.1 hypothetical protein [Paenibacillus sp. PFR10]
MGNCWWCSRYYSGGSETVTVDESVAILSNQDELQMTRAAQLRVTGYLNNGLIGDLAHANVQYFVDRTDLAEVDSNGLLTLQSLDGATDHITVWATVTMDGVTLTTPTLAITIKDLTVIVDSTDTTGLYSTEGSKHQSVTEVTYIDATVGTSSWVNLGTFDFTGDGSEYVRLTRETPTTVDPPTLPADMIYTRVDAVKFER